MNLSMHASSSILRPLASAIILPLTLLAAACSDDADPEADGAGVGGGTAGSRASAAGSGGAGTGGTPAAGGTNGSNGGAAGSAGNTGGGAGDATLGGGGRIGTGPPAVELGTADEYAILAQTGISNTPTSAIRGSLGLSPAASSYVTGFTLTRAGTRWTSPEVTGGVYAADNDPTTPADLITAVSDMGTAYDDAASRANPEFLNLGDGAIGGRTLVPGLYRWTSTVTIPDDVTLAGSASAVWIFQITGDLNLAAGQQMTLSGGAQAKNIVWQVAGAVSLGATSHAEGIILSKSAINLGAGSSVNGRLLAQTAVALQISQVNEPAQ